MHELQEQQTLNNLSFTKFLLGILIIASLFVVTFYFDLGKVHADSEKLVTLKVTASDTPEYVPYSKHDKIRYSLKAQEYNCRFWITDGGFEIIRNNKALHEQMKRVQRGDDLRIVIFESEEKEINRLYYKATVVGLAIKDSVIFAPEEMRFVGEEKRKSNLWTASIVWVVILTLLIIVRLASLGGNVQAHG